MFRWGAAVGLGLILVAAGLLAMAVQDEALIARPATISIEHIARAREIIDLHDPAKGSVEGRRILVLSQDDFDLLVNYGAHQFLGASTQVVLRPGSAVLRGSLPVRAGPFGNWLNVDAWLRESDGLPVFAQLRIGRLQVPGFAADLLLARLMARLDANARSQAPSDLVRHLKFGNAELQLTYDWRADEIRRVLAALMPENDGQGRLKAYQDRLVQRAALLPPGRPVALASLLPPLFDLARQRSADGDAAEENRAAIVVLAFHALGRHLGEVVPSAKAWPQPAPQTLYLSRRHDSALHFITSAAIAVAAGSPLADAIGLYKEVDDSRHTSGFSFNDLAHDRAGTRFGEMAAKDPERLQRRAAAGGLSERDLMPDVSDLPEDMPEAEFIARFGGVGGAAYGKVTAEIDARIATRSLFR